MAVNVGQRNVPDTPANRQLEAGQKALDLAIHTIKICGNEKIFDPKYQASLTDDIIDCAKRIYLDVWTGNNVYVTEKMADLRIEKNTNLMQLCSVVG